MDNHLEEWIIEADITSMQAEMTAGRVTSEDLVNIYLERIRKYDPVLRSVLELNPQAIDIARTLDHERKDKGPRGPLHGIPVLLKDNIDTHDDMHTSAGSLALAESIAPEDSYVAARLRAAGAVFLGKTNMTEWANFMSPTMWAGYSARGGLVLNPYGPGELFIGGSSSGSAAAVAANLGAAAIGTETSGSIIGPAGRNCLVGLKPTVGLIPSSGIIPITYSQDCAGPMTRTVTDTAILLGALTVEDKLQDYRPYLNREALKQARIGIPRFYYQDLDEARLAIIEEAISQLKAQGAVIVDPVHLPCEDMEWDGNVMRYEFKAALNSYLGKLPDDVPVHSLSEVIAYNEQYGEAALKYGQDTLIWSEETSGTLTEEVYLEGRRKDLHMSREQGIDHALQSHQLDALLFLDDEGGADIAARAGYPSITVPGGFAATGVIAPGGYTTKGHQGITFVGTAFSEPVLLGLAYAYEQASVHRVAPKLD
ncbi:amidase family protein [Paenibacillus agri]|uniref:Amidase n=1 Tax=Paenibacillus agri TaxID=2744309 RepID=A0A850EUA1_9BACL|nr:amidase family protein [Paenibacillus agri]NUU61511.1 amidase [Paenibacillus agri]